MVDNFQLLRANLSNLNRSKIDRSIGSNGIAIDHKLNLIGIGSNAGAIQWHCSVNHTRSGQLPAALPNAGGLKVDRYHHRIVRCWQCYRFRLLPIPKVVITAGKGKIRIPRNTTLIPQNKLLR